MMLLLVQSWFILAEEFAFKGFEDTWKSIKGTITQRYIMKYYFFNDSLYLIAAIADGNWNKLEEFSTIRKKPLPEGKIKEDILREYYDIYSIQRQGIEVMAITGYYGVMLTDHLTLYPEKHILILYTYFVEPE
jgi:hypothetical protein